MIDLTAIMTGLGLFGAGAVWLVKQDRRISGTKLRLADHEDACETRYEAINQTMRRIEHSLEKQDKVSELRHKDAQEQRQALQMEIGKINQTVSAHAENLRMRERFEDMDGHESR